MMPVIRCFPPSLRCLVLGMAAVTVSGLAGCDSTSNSLTRSPDGGTAGLPTKSQLSPNRDPAIGPRLPGNTDIGPLSSPLPVPGNGARPGVQPGAQPGAQPRAKTLPLPGGATASKETLGRGPSGSNQTPIPGGIPANLPQLPTGGAELPSVGSGSQLPANGAQLPSVGTQPSAPSATVSDELAKLQSELAKARETPQAPVQAPLAAPAPVKGAQPATAALPASASLSPVPSPAELGALGDPGGADSGLTEEAKALSQPVNPNVSSAASSSPSTSLPSVRSNSLPSLGFSTSRPSTPRGNRPNANSGRASGRPNPSGLQTAGYVYNPSTGGYDSGN